MNARGFLALLLAFQLVACSPADPEPRTIEREGNPPVTPIPAEDAVMNIAMQRARDTLDEYRGRLTNPPPTQTYLSLKAQFEDDDYVEHMWIRDVEITETGFRGRLGNEPVNITSVAFGDVVEVPVAKVSDWMAVDDGRLVAGYTLRVLRDRMPPAQREAFDSNLDFVID